METRIATRWKTTGERCTHHVSPSSLPRLVPHHPLTHRPTVIELLGQWAQVYFSFSAEDWSSYAPPIRYNDHVASTSIFRRFFFPSFLLFFPPFLFFSLSLSLSLYRFLLFLLSLLNQKCISKDGFLVPVFGRRPLECVSLNWIRRDLFHFFLWLLLLLCVETFAWYLFGNDGSDLTGSGTSLIAPFACLSLGFLVLEPLFLSFDRLQINSASFQGSKWSFRSMAAAEREFIWNWSVRNDRLCFGNFRTSFHSSPTYRNSNSSSSNNNSNNNNRKKEWLLLVLVLITRIRYALERNNSAASSIILKSPISIDWSIGTCLVDELP